MQGGLGGGTVSMRPGIDAGESYVREVAAYLLVRDMKSCCPCLHAWPKKRQSSEASRERERERATLAGGTAFVRMSPQYSSEAGKGWKLRLFILGEIRTTTVVVYRALAA